MHCYCSISLEQRLARLEGGRGRRKQLTSKDILQSLSEARDDHMQQLVNRTSTGEGRNGPWTTGRDRRTGSGRESPYSIRNEFADVDLGEGGESGEIGRRETRVGGAWGGGKRTAVKRENRRKTGGSAWTCCLCCRGVYRVSLPTVYMCRLGRSAVQIEN